MENTAAGRGSDLPTILTLFKHDPKSRSANIFSGAEFGPDSGTNLFTSQSSAQMGIGPRVPTLHRHAQFYSLATKLCITARLSLALYRIASRDTPINTNRHSIQGTCFKVSGVCACVLSLPLDRSAARNPPTKIDTAHKVYVSESQVCSYFRISPQEVVTQSQRATGHQNRNNIQMAKQ